MRLTTILNRVETYKSFVYGTGRWERKMAVAAGGSEELTVVVPVRARKGAKAA